MKRLNSRPYISIKQKLLGSYLVILIIPILLVGIYLTSSIRTNLIDNKMAEIENNNERIRTDYTTILSSVIRVSDWIYQDEELVDLVQTVYESPFEVYQAYNGYRMFEDYLRYYDEIQHIRFYVENPSLTSTTGIYPVNEDIANKEWYQRGRSRSGQILWMQIEDPVTGKTHLNLVRAVYQDYQFVGLLAIAVNDQMIRNLLADSASSVFITLDSQTPIFSYPETPDIVQAYSGYVPLLNSVESAEGNHSVQNTDFPQGEFTLNIRNVQVPKTLDAQMQVIGVVPTDSILRDVNKDLRLAYWIVIGVLVISILMLIIFIRTFNSRIIRLKEAMNMVSNGQFSIPPTINGNDELSDVYNQLAVTAKSIEELIQINYEHVVREKNWQLQIKDAQYKMLASQINPHFLYNTLEMIRMKALKNKDREVAEIVTILSKLMRKALESKQGSTKLSEELEFIKTYLKIQKLRFGDQIEYTIVNDAEQDPLIMPLIIQPIVENSFIHGIEPKVGKGMIKIRVHESHQQLIITIIDNGVGISEQTLERIRSSLEADHDTDHIGIANVHQRILYRYGPPYGLKIDSQAGKGTIVTISIPINQNKEGDQ
ncbi:histidine kinase [Marinilactibacillus piezotolerans]|uniref:histidine kinase n=1 Tax=Marinilactibacillus piezotolerans TaxID=258723 RepID=UPI0009B17681|nr:histidine kinase [Marinilactibacillus piezotolerans]